METTSTPVKEAMQFRLNFGLLTEIIKKKTTLNSYTRSRVLKSFLFNPQNQISYLTLERFPEKQSLGIWCNPRRQSSNLNQSLIFVCINRNSMRLRLFGFPDESPHAILGPDDFCITKMMLPGLMELRVSGGISLHSPELVDKTRVCPLTQSTTKLLTQQS